MEPQSNKSKGSGGDNSYFSSGADPADSSGQAQAVPSGGHDALRQWIADRIRTSGPVTFARYMEWALYHPVWGYYTTGPGIGPGGDFTTSPEVSPAFGELMARHVADIDTLLGEPPTLNVVEFGPGRGTLAAGLLDTLHAGYRPVYERVACWLVEISPALISAQKRRLLPDHAPLVRWVSGLDELPAGLDGAVLANEFVDAFPVHVVENHEGQVLEHYVGLDTNGELCITLGGLSDPRLAEFLRRYRVSLVPGQKIEINLAAEEWIARLGGRLGRGVVTIIDYGDVWPARYSDARREGTLLAYYGGRVSDRLLAHPGGQDLTALVDFTALEQAAHRAGLYTLALTRQAHFLIGLGLDTTRAFASAGENLQTALALRRSLQALVSMEGLGRFHVLVLGKGIDMARARATLSGLRYAHLMEQDPRV